MREGYNVNNLRTWYNCDCWIKLNDINNTKYNNKCTKTGH